jgi:kexin
VAGILALVMQVRPDLTWRDVQHLCVQTAIPINLKDSGWQNTTVPGRLFSHKFGFGKLSAYRIVEAAKSFVSVNDQTQMTIESSLKHQVNSSMSLAIDMVVSEEMALGANASDMEHLRLTFSTLEFVRSEINVKVISPGGVESFLIPSRKFDSDSKGFTNWTAMSVASWFFPLT